MPYCIAAAIVDRKVTPVQFTPEKINDPQIRAQLRKVEVVADPEIEKAFPALQRVVVTITTTDGKEFSKQLDYPKGDPRNPLSDLEVEEKFAALADGVISRPRQQRVREAIWNLEKTDSVTELMALLKEEKSTAATTSSPLGAGGARMVSIHPRAASIATFGCEMFRAHK